MQPTEIEALESCQGSQTQRTRSANCWKLSSSGAKAPIPPAQNNAELR